MANNEECFNEIMDFILDNNIKEEFISKVEDCYKHDDFKYLEMITVWEHFYNGFK